MKRYILLPLLILPFSILFAQQSKVGNWIMYSGNQDINKNWVFNNDVQYRSFNAIGDLETFIVRLGIGRNLKPNNNTISMGGIFIKSAPYTPGTNIKTDKFEFRVYQQFIAKQQFHRFYIQHRFRFEERFIDDVIKTRVRYLTGLNLPINKKGMLPKAFYLSLYNELFLNTSNKLFDRTRIYAALGNQLTKSLKLEMGLMRQVFQKTGRTQFQIAFFNNLPLHKD